jgi:hypothetical protein
LTETFLYPDDGSDMFFRSVGLSLYGVIFQNPLPLILITMGNSNEGNVLHICSTKFVENASMFMSRVDKQAD